MNPNRPCKFGDSCKNIINGQPCPFYHPPIGGGGRQPNPGFKGPNSGFGRGGNQDGFRNPNTGGGGGFKNNNNNGGFNYPTNDGNFGNNNNNGGNFGNNQNGGYGYPSNNNNNNNTGGNSQMGGGGFYKPKQDQFQSQFCLAFQLGQQCKFGEKCKKKHAFTVQNQLIRRDQTRNYPNHATSKLTTFNMNGNHFFALRMGHKISFLLYDFTANKLEEKGNWSLPDMNIQYNFYDQKNQYIYFAAENKQTQYHDLMFYNLGNQVGTKVENAHTSKITGILHLTDKIICSTSLDGNFKVWNYNSQNNTLALDKNTSDKVVNYYKNNNQLPQLLFLDICQFNKMKITSVGTNDGRILFWIGNQMNFMQANFSQQYGRIFKVLFYSVSGTPIAMILAWTLDKSKSGIIALNLSDFKICQTIIQVQTDANSPRLNISTMQISGDLLFVGNAYGTINLYKIPNFKERVGVIMNNNIVNDIISIQHTTETNIHSRMVFILESMFNNKEGSLAVYLNKV